MTKKNEKRSSMIKIWINVFILTFIPALAGVGATILSLTLFSFYIALFLGSAIACLAGMIVILHYLSYENLMELKRNNE